MSDLVNLNPKTEAIFQLVQSGKTIEEAWKLLKPDKVLTSANKHYLSKKLAQYELLTPQNIKLATNAVKKTLQGKAIGEAKPPNHSDVIKVTEMIWDRIIPKTTHNINENVNISLSPVDLNKYKVIDVDSEEIDQ